MGIINCVNTNLSFRNIFLFSSRIKFWGFCLRNMYNKIIVQKIPGDSRIETEGYKKLARDCSFAITLESRSKKKNENPRKLRVRTSSHLIPAHFTCDSYTMQSIGSCRLLLPLSGCSTSVWRPSPAFRLVTTKFRRIQCLYGNSRHRAFFC